jgi:hypothetical protein
MSLFTLGQYEALAVGGQRQYLAQHPIGFTLREGMPI